MSLFAGIFLAGASRLFLNINRTGIGLTPVNTTPPSNITPPSITGQPTMAGLWGLDIGIWENPESNTYVGHLFTVPTGGVAVSGPYDPDVPITSPFAATLGATYFYQVTATNIISGLSTTVRQSVGFGPIVSGAPEAIATGLHVMSATASTAAQTSTITMDIPDANMRKLYVAVAYTDGDSSTATVVGTNNIPTVQGVAMTFVDSYIQVVSGREIHMQIYEMDHAAISTGLARSISVHKPAHVAPALGQSIAAVLLRNMPQGATPASRVHKYATGTPITVSGSHVSGGNELLLNFMAAIQMANAGGTVSFGPGQLLPLGSDPTGGLHYAGVSYFDMTAPATATATYTSTSGQSHRMSSMIFLQVPK